MNDESCDFGGAPRPEVPKIIGLATKTGQVTPGAKKGAEITLLGGQGLMES